MRLLVICTLLSNSNAILYCLFLLVNRVCARHFINGMPTTENPKSQVEFGYKKLVSAGRRQLLRSPLSVTEKKRRVVDNLNLDFNESTNDTATNNLELEHNQVAGYDVRLCSSIKYKNYEI